MSHLNPIYKFISEPFELGGEIYNVCMTPILHFEEDGLDFSGDYIGILIHPQIGTIQFTLTPDDSTGWEVDVKDFIEPGIIDVLGDMIERSQKL
jgi:hypothetical protein